MSSPDDFDTAPDEFVDAHEKRIAAMDDPLGDRLANINNNNGGEEDEEGNVGIDNDQLQDTKDGLFSGLKFYINTKHDAYETESDIETLTRLVQSNDGVVLLELPELNTIDQNRFFVISPYNSTQFKTVTSTYIKACCQNDTLLKVENYLVPFDEFRSAISNSLTNESQNLEQNSSSHIPNHGLSASQPSSQSVTPPVADSDLASSYAIQKPMVQRTNMPTHNKTSFTEEEDEFVLDVVRKNPTRRTTHTLFDEISHYVPNHTGNSIRHRYRVYLSTRLEFVYEVDSTGKLIRDGDGNLIKTKVLPPSLKKKFTADEDFSLAIGIKKQFYRDLFQVDPDSGSSLINADDTPVTVAKRKVTMAPNLVPGSEPSFKDYRVNERRGPLAREFFKQFGENNPTHTENAWRDRFRKFLVAYGIDAYIDYFKNEKKNGNQPEPMKNFTTRPKRVGLSTPGNYSSVGKKVKLGGAETHNAAVAAAAAAASVGASVGASSGNGPSNYTIPESELLDEATMNFISSLKNDLSKIDNNIPFEYPQEIAEAIRNDFSLEEAEFDNIEPDSIPFPPEIASIDLFLPQFFRMSSTREFLSNIHEVISRDYEPSQAEKLVQDLCDETGVRKTFSTSILTALSGDLMVFPRYFLNMFKHNVNPPMNVPGVWTREDDTMLKTNKEEDIQFLTKKHGSGRIEMRRRFVEKDLI